MVAVNSIRWKGENLAGYFDSTWEITGGNITNQGGLSLSVGGKAVKTLTDSVDMDFKYVRLLVEFYSSGVSAENNYRNKPTIYIREAYKDSNNMVDKVKVRSIGFNLQEVVGENLYSDDTIYATLDRSMAKMTITIQNDSTSVLRIDKLGIYQSQDISEKSIRQVTTGITREASTSSIKVYRNSNNSPNGLGMVVNGIEIKVKPTFFNGQVIAFETNYGATITVQNINEVISLLDETKEE